MTFWYDEEDDDLVGNVGEEYAEIDENGDLRIDVSWIYDEGRGTDKLEEMKRRIDDAIEAH